MSQPVVYKEDSEIIAIGWDYSPETVSSATITITPTGGASDLAKQGSETKSGGEVYQRVKSGDPGENYRVMFTVITDEGNNYVDVILVSVYSA